MRSKSSKIKQIVLLLLFGAVFNVGYAQQTGIGTTTPDSSSVLDITATDKGVLVPRIDLTSTTLDLDGQPGQATGLLIFNTGNTLAQGFYFWNGTEWKSVNNASGNGNVNYDTTQEFTYVDENGESQSINLEELVKQHETVTFLENNGNGLLSYINEARDTVTIDVGALANGVDGFIPRTSVYAQSREEQVFGSSSQYNRRTKFEITFTNEDIVIDPRGVRLIDNRYWEVQYAGKYDFVLTSNFYSAGSSVAVNLNVEYSTDNGGTWIVGAGSRNLSSSGSVQTFHVTGLIDLPKGALIRLILSKGSGDVHNTVTTNPTGEYGRVYSKSIKIMRLE